MLGEGADTKVQLPPILAFGTNAWDGYWQTRQQVLSRLAARGWPVAYTTPALSIWERRTARWREASWAARKVVLDDVVVRYPGRVPPLLHRSHAFDDFVMRRHARKLLQCVPSGRMRRPIAYVFHPEFLPCLDALPGCRVVFHADDNFSAMPQADPSVHAYQRALVERASVILAITESVAQGLGEGAQGKTRIMPNGADFELFRAGSRQAVPADLAGIPRPIVLYAGSLNEKIDFPLIASLARQRPDVSWVLVGPVWSGSVLSERTQSGLAECRSLANVFFLGQKHHQELPAYCAHADINAMFYRTDGNGWWQDIYPLKLHECLATGLPLLSADTPAVREFAHVVSLCRDQREWIEALDLAIAGNGRGSPGERQDVARANSWDRRVDVIEAVLRELDQAEG